MTTSSLCSARRPPSFRTGFLAFAVASGALFAPSALADDDHEGDHELVQFLSRTGLDPDGVAVAQWEDEGDEVEFEVELSLMDAGDHELWVGGVLRGTITVGLDGRGEIEFESGDDDEGEDDSGGEDELPLDFDPIDQLVEIRQGAEVFFSDVFAPGAVGAGSSEDEEIEIEVYLVNVGGVLDFDARGRMKFEQEDGGTETEFEVEVEDLDAGPYELRVGGVVVTTFDTTGFEEVELEFRDPFGGDSDEDEDEDELELHLALDFDPLGQIVEVARQGSGEVILSAVLPESAGMSGGDAYANGHQWAKDKGKKLADKLLIKLQSSGHMPGAKGKAVLEIDDDDGGEQELEVEIEGVGDGSFDVCLDGAPVGTILTASGEGELKLSTEPEAGEVLLTAPVRGALLEVKAAGMVVLSSTFPVSVPDALDGYKPEKHKFFPGTTDLKRLKLNLRNAVEDLDTLGTLDWRQKSAGVKLVVKFIDLPDGEYGLWLDGVEVAEVEVENGKGKAKFLEGLVAPSGSAEPLDFDVLDGHFEVRDDDGDVHLRVFVD